MPCLATASRACSTAGTAGRLEPTRWLWLMAGARPAGPGLIDDRDRQRRAAAPLYLHCAGAADPDLRRRWPPCARLPTFSPISTSPWSASSGPITGCRPTTCPAAWCIIYERSVTTQVNDIEHIESQSLPGYGIVKIFFQKSVNINAALAQVTAAVADRAEAAAGRHHAALCAAASTPPRCRSCRSRCPARRCRRQTLFDYAQNFIRPQLASVPGAAIPSPYGGKVRQIQVDIDQQPMQPYGLSAQDVGNALARAEPDHAGRNREDRQVRIHRRAQRQPDADRRAERSADQEGQWHDRLHARRRLRA